MLGKKNRLIVILFVCIAAIGITFGPASAGKLTRKAKITLAMKAAPLSISRHATIMDIDGTILRKGTNGWICMPSSGPGSTHPMCNDAVWMRALDAFSKKAGFHTDRIGISYMLAGDDLVVVAGQVVDPVVADALGL